MGININLKNHNGITMLALVITVIILLIISGIALTSGSKITEKTRAENIVTNMISIKAKTKVCLEEVNSQTWNLDIDRKKAKLVSEPYYFKVIANDESIQELVDENIKKDGCTCYEITQATLDYMNLDEIYGYNKIGEKGIHYVAVVNNSDFTKIEMVYTKGVKYLGTTYKTLSQLQEIL